MEVLLKFFLPFENLKKKIIMSEEDYLFSTYTTINTNTIPSMSQVKDFIRKNPRATVLEIRNFFQQKVADNSRFYVGGKFVAFDMSSRFFQIIYSLLSEEDVEVNIDKMAHLISDSEMCLVGDDEYIPIVFTIKE
jgi:hypothetical protein